MPDPVVSNTIDDSLFPTNIGEGAQGGPRFSTTILSMFAGSEQRCQNWLDPLLKWNVNWGVKDKTDFMTLLAFFRARGGRNRGFLFFDPLDNQAYAQPIGVGDGTTTQFQLARHYVTNRVQSRPITRPVSGSVVVYLNGATAGACTVDHTTGIVTMTTAPGAGVSITADYQFYVPVRFDTDSMGGNLDIGTTTGWDSVPIVEIREPFLPLVAAPAAAVSSFPDVLSRQMGGPSFGTQIATSVSGWEERGSQWTTSRLKWEIEESMLTYADAQSLLNWFRTHAGRAKTWHLKDWTDYQMASEPMVGSGTSWQLVKRYTDGGVTIVRNISQPDGSTLAIIDGVGSPLSGYTVDINGVVTFTSTPTGTPAATCNFLTPVRFDTDQLSMRHVEAQCWTVDSLSVIEVDPVPAAQEGGV